MSSPTAHLVRHPGVLHLVVPATIDDPRQPSGGNVYDHELARGLRSLGHRVREHRVPGAWPAPTGPSGAGLDRVLATLPGEATVLVDGLLGLGAPQALVRERQRLRLWLLVHLPLALISSDVPEARVRERRALRAAAGVIATSDWTRGWLIATYGLDPARVRVARPGVHPAGAARPTADGGALVCVGSVVPAKGQDVLVAALTDLRDLRWSCRLVGPLDRSPGFVDRLREQVRDSGLPERVDFTGPLPRPAVTAALGTADLLVLPSRLETYGMVVTEALARGVPVLATDVGGVTEALGSAPDGRAPGVLVPPGDVPALGGALRRWLQDASYRRQLRASARARRGSLSDWSSTAHSVHRALREVPLNHSTPPAVSRA